MVYLIKEEVRNGTYFKIGFTHNITERLRQYYTHNPECKLLETIDTYRKTKHQLETEIHAEVKAMGFEFKVAPNGTVTEWFFVPQYCEKEFEHKGLKQFKACQGRKIYSHRPEEVRSK